MKSNTSKVLIGCAIACVVTIAVAVLIWLYKEPAPAPVTEPEEYVQEPGVGVPSVIGATVEEDVTAEEPSVVEEPQPVEEEVPPVIYEALEESYYTEDVPEVIANNPAWAEYLASEYFDESVEFNFDVTSDRISAVYFGTDYDVMLEYVFDSLIIAVNDVNTRETLALFEGK